MQLSIVSVGRKMPDWVQSGMQEYTRRFPRAWQFTLRELSQANSGSTDVDKAREAEAMLSAIDDKAHVVALDNRGKSWSTADVSQQLSRWQDAGKPVVLLIGGPDGLHDSALERAQQAWSLSPLTFPHPMVRVIIAEQLYRAHSILVNHPYHRA